MARYGSPGEELRENDRRTPRNNKVRNCPGKYTGIDPETGSNKKVMVSWVSRRKAATLSSNVVKSSGYVDHPVLTAQYLLVKVVIFGVPASEDDLRKGARVCGDEIADFGEGDQGGVAAGVGAIGGGARRGRRSTRPGGRSTRWEWPGGRRGRRCCARGVRPRCAKRSDRIHGYRCGLRVRWYLPSIG